MRELKRVVIKEELLALCENDFTEAIILHQMIFWQGTINRADSEIHNEIEQRKKLGLDYSKLENKLRNGWFWKTAQELSEEIMGIKSRRTCSRALESLTEKKFLLSKPNIRGKWDNTLGYKVDLDYINSELEKLGYSLQGYTKDDNKPSNSPSGQNDHSEGQNDQSTGHPDSSSGQNDHSKGQNDRTVTESELQSLTSVSNAVSIFQNSGSLPATIIARLSTKTMIDRLILHSHRLSISLDNAVNDIIDLYHDYKHLLSDEQITSCIVDCLKGNISSNFKGYLGTSLNNKVININRISNPNQKNTSTEVVPEWFGDNTANYLSKDENADHVDADTIAKMMQALNENKKQNKVL